MLAVPGLTPVITPVVIPTVAIPVLPLLHVPPIVALLKVVVCPTQTTGLPELVASAAFTVTTAVRAQPVATV